MTVSKNCFAWTCLTFHSLTHASHFPVQRLVLPSELVALKEEVILESLQELVNKTAAWAPLPGILVQQHCSGLENLVS